MNYPLLAKCQRYAKEHGLEGMAAIERTLAKDPDFIEVHFSPAAEGTQPGKAVYSFDENTGILDAEITVSDGMEPKAVFSCKAKGAIALQIARGSLESLCSAFNPKPPKQIAFKGTRWGKVEIRHSDLNHRNYYRPDSAVLYTDRVIEYLTREEAEQFMGKEMKCLPPCGLVDESFSLDYPLFKMRIRRRDGKFLTSAGADGIWWVDVPMEYDLSRENVSWVLYEYFHMVLLAAAEEYFEEKVAYYQSKMNTPKKVRKVHVSFIKRNAVGVNHLLPEEPGSSRDKGERDLYFDAKLMAYPEKFTDSVIIHELCHNIVWEHSKKFYDLEANWCLSLLKVGPHYYDDFLLSHRLYLFAPNPWKEIK